MNLLTQEINSMEELRGYRTALADISHFIVRVPVPVPAQILDALIETTNEVERQEIELIEKMYQASIQYEKTIHRDETIEH